MHEKRGTGFLLQLPLVPAAGDQQDAETPLRDPAGKWLIVDGIPLHPAPFDARSVTFVVIDSGVLADHPQLRGLIAEESDFTGEGTEDRIGHGNAVSAGNHRCAQSR